MVYSKTLDSKLGLSRVRFNPAQVLKIANFVPFTLPANREELERLLTEKPKVLADFAAAVVTQLHYRDQAYQDHTSNDSYIETLCNFFHNSIQGKGFALKADIASLQGYGTDARWIIIVPGCQTRAIYTSRVKAAYNFVKELQPKRGVVVFSGANPAAEKAGDESLQAHARTLSEAAEMHQIYLDLKKKDRTKPKVPELPLKEETQAASSIQNVEKALGSLNLDTKDHNICVLVSSLFHIGRLGMIAEQFLKLAQQPVSQLIMIGAENPCEHNLAKEAQEYVKSGTFEMLSEMFSSVPLDQLFSPRYY